LSLKTKVLIGRVYEQRLSSPAAHASERRSRTTPRSGGELAASMPRRSNQLQLVRRFAGDSKNSSGELDQVVTAGTVTVALDAVLS
jgi:hypothetical protein